MGSTSSKSLSSLPGLITIGQRADHASAAPDSDLAQLHRLPSAAPLVRPPTLGNFFSGGQSSSLAELPGLHPRNVSVLCREYASLTRNAAMPLCNMQRDLLKKMSAVEALCARVLYLIALRSSELAASAAMLRELGALGVRVAEVEANVRQAAERAERYERLLRD